MNQSTTRIWLRLIALIPLAIGLFLSFTYADVYSVAAETGRSALSLLHHGYIGNPYSLPTGPTAHVSPTNVAVLAVVFHFFGDNSAQARTVMSVICTILYCLNALMTILICERFRVRTAGIVIAACMTCIVPVFMYEPIINARYWDQPFGAVILMVALYVLLDALQNEAPPTMVRAVGLAMLAGLAALTSPVLLPTIVMAFAILAHRSRDRLYAIKATLLGTLIVAVIVTPWAVRNELMMGGFILTRSNFGLELAIGNQDGATGTVLPNSTISIHPYSSKVAASRVNKIGEIEFMREMATLGERWIETHPISTLKLTARRAQLLFFPEREMIGFIPVVHGVAWYWFLVLGIMRIMAFLRVLVSGPMRLLWFSFTLLPAVPYLITHVEVRYEYIVFFPSICMFLVAFFGANQSHAKNASQI